MTNEEIAESLVRNHRDFKAEGLSEYMNGYFNGIIEGLEYAQAQKIVPVDPLLSHKVCNCVYKFNEDHHWILLAQCNKCEGKNEQTFSDNKKTKN